MQGQRADQFARCAVALSHDLQEVPEDGDPFVDREAADISTELVGAEGLFDTGLTNGLAAIVASEWPGEEAYANGFALPASGLLGVMESHLTPNAEGILVIPDSQAGRRHNSVARDTRIDVPALRDGVAVTQRVRHARGTGDLKRRHIDALLALDHHPSLRKLSETREDRAWEDAMAEDVRSQAQAADLLNLIGDDEAARRAAAVDNPNDYHPRHNPDGQDLALCPVCEYQAFCVQGLDLWGRVGFGQCLVCTYTRSPMVADQEGYGEHIADL
ncbi:hypothetical protein [Streptomyces pseudovenezuelae]|nr:hypothetical protein [Streptomyces pseudovenezuelae]